MDSLCHEEDAYIIESKDECKTAVQEIETIEKNNINIETSKTFPKGCYHVKSSHKTYFNKHHDGKRNRIAEPICHRIGSSKQ